MVPPVFVVLALSIAGTAAAAKPHVPPPSTQLTGNFAGEGAALRVVPTGAVVQGVCASGKIPVKVLVDRNGRFVANGYFNRYHPVIRLSDLAPGDTRARFAGELTGDVLVLTISIAGKPDQRHQLLRDAPARFATCD